MSGERYPVATLVQMADIPEEALPRFLAELPAIIESLRQVIASAPDLATEMKAKAPFPLNRLPVSCFAKVVEHAGSHSLTWVDDDKGTATVSMALRRGDEPFYRRSEKMGGSA